MISHMNNKRLAEMNRERLQTMCREKHLKRPILKRTRITTEQRTHFAAWLNELAKQDIATAATVQL
jgi:hypothetical protein